MSGWVHKCCNGNRIVVRHGDMSGYVEAVRVDESGEPEAVVLIPGCDLIQVVADHVRHERFSKAERDIDDMSVAELFGLDGRIQKPPYATER